MPQRTGEFQGSWRSILGHALAGERVRPASSIITCVGCWLARSGARCSAVDLTSGKAGLVSLTLFVVPLATQNRTPLQTTCVGCKKAGPVFKDPFFSF